MQGVEREFLVSQVLGFDQCSHSRSFTFFNPKKEGLGDDLSMLVGHRPNHHFTSAMPHLNTSTQLFSIEGKPLLLFLIKDKAAPLEEKPGKEGTIDVGQQERQLRTRNRIMISKLHDFKQLGELVGHVPVESG